MAGKQRYRIVDEPTPPSGVEMPTDAKALAAHRDSLYRRLEIGYDRIERGLSEGADVTSWEDFWVALLKEYERCCDELTRDLSHDEPTGRDGYTQGSMAISPGVR